MTDHPARYVAVDLEATTLDVRFAEPLEIAAVPFDPLDAGVYHSPVMTFVPHHEPAVVHRADPEALTVNRYYERKLYAGMLDPADTIDAAEQLADLLAGATLVGANPAYDSTVLWAWLSKRLDLGAPPWHHRLYDVELATAITLGLDRIPGLAECAAAFDIDRQTRHAAHTAAGDAFLAADVCASVHAHRRDDRPLGSDYIAVR